jgi:hypothetical protein
LEIVIEICSSRGVSVLAVGIDGDAELEAAWREQIPVVEVDGVVAFTLFVHPERLEALLDG